MKGQMGKFPSVNGRVLNLDRNRAAGPWMPLVPIPIPEDGKAAGVIASYQNNKFRVHVREVLNGGLLMAGPTGKPQPVPMLHLTVIAPDGGRAPTYEERLRIVRGIVNEEADAVEILPAKHREVSTPFTHLWVFPPGYTLPIGFMPKPPDIPMDAEIIPGSAITKADLMFYVVATPAAEGVPVVEVFASEEDARVAYAANGAEAPTTGEMRMYGTIPPPEEAAWSPQAQERLADLRARLDAAAQAMAQQVPPAGADLAQAMEAGIAEKREQRAAAIDKAIEDETDAVARADLEAMRRELVQSGRLDPKATDHGDAE